MEDHLKFLKLWHPRFTCTVRKLKKAKRHRCWEFVIRAHGGQEIGCSVTSRAKAIENAANKIMRHITRNHRNRK